MIDVLLGNNSVKENKPETYGYSLNTTKLPSSD
jgi:hypothetical protein